MPEKTYFDQLREIYDKMSLSECNVHGEFLRDCLNESARLHKYNQKLKDSKETLEKTKHLYSTQLTAYCVIKNFIDEREKLLKKKIRILDSLLDDNSRVKSKSSELLNRILANTPADEDD